MQRTSAPSWRRQTHRSSIYETSKEGCNRVPGTKKSILSDQEYNYIKSTISKCAVPTIQLLIKDHKKESDENGNYFTRLVVPAKNFTAAFPHVGQQGINKIIEKNKIDYSRKSIIQASDLKQQLEIPNIRNSKHTVISIDAEKMFPSIKFGQIQKAVNYFLRKVPKAEKEKAEKCLDLVKFGMANTLITIEEKY